MSIEQRIERVIQNLLPLTAFEDKLGTPKPLRERLEQCHTPGASIAVINNFEIEWARGFGLIEAGTALEVKPTTLFQAGSISKPIFALAVMRLVQEGRGYTPQQVRASAELLRKSVKYYVFISAVSVYGDPDSRPVRETCPLLSPASEDVTEVNGETYGLLKVACEIIVQEVYGSMCTLLRPQVVVGRYDTTARYTYWLNRAQQGGEMLAPGDGSDHLQVIDVRDLAHFTLKVVEDKLTGAFNLAGRRITWGEFMRIIGADNLVWVDVKVIESADLTFLELPLFRPLQGARSSLMDVSNERAQAAGLKLTDPKVTAHDTLLWFLKADMTSVLPKERQAQLLSAEREAQLIKIQRTGA